MNLLERYLNAVKFFLPPKQQDDIVRELSVNLASEMDEREDELGRPLTEDEEVEILRRHGHPMIVAGRYRSRQHLIGPVFFPIYLFALKIGLGVALIVTVVLAGVGGVLYGDPVNQLLRAMLAFPGRALMVFAWTTLGFVVVDAAQSRFKMTHTWDPRQLPRVTHEPPIGGYRTLCELLFLIASLVWLMLLPQAPFLALGPAAAVIEPSAVWRLPYIAIVVMTLAKAVLHAIDFVRPYRTTARAIARVALNVGSFATVLFLLRAGEWFVARPSVVEWNGVPVERLLEIVNAACQLGFLAATVVSLIEVVRGVYKISVRRHAVSGDSAHAR